MATVLVIGGGAIGSFLAASFIASGIEARILARGARLAEIARQGVMLAQDASLSRVAVPAIADCEGLDPPDFAILCCKAGDLASCLDVSGSAVGPETVMVTVQNGVNAPDIVAARFPDQVVIASRVHGFFELEAGMVRHVGVRPSLSLGTWGGIALESARRLADLLARAGIRASVSHDIRADLWEKFVLASALGGVGAATGLAVGAIRSDPESNRLLEAAIREVCSLARRMGVVLPDDTAARTIAFIAGFPPEATTSLMRDLEAGRLSEYASLTGAVLRLADRAGLDIPAFRTIEAMLASRGLLPAAC